MMMAALFPSTGNAFAQLPDKDPVAIDIPFSRVTAEKRRDSSPKFQPFLYRGNLNRNRGTEARSAIFDIPVSRSAKLHDLLFKKPWALSKKVDFMIGVGPQWVHAKKYGMATNSVSGEAVLDFMFWPSAKHRPGWYVEPGYEYNFGPRHEQSFGITGGLLIAIR